MEKYLDKHYDDLTAIYGKIYNIERRCTDSRTEEELCELKREILSMRRDVEDQIIEAKNQRTIEAVGKLVSELGKLFQ